MKKKIWASTRITMHNLIYRIAFLEACGNYAEAEVLRGLFKRDLDNEANTAIKAEKEKMRQFLIQKTVYNS